ncbi:MAG TPA: type VI secretion system ATPase TssH, partial [bacterium]|nr:type VI secretion system ATPase TssH [bacterium]
SRLNGHCANVLQSAAGMCVTRTHYEVTVEHFMAKLLDDPNSDVPIIMRQFDLDPGRVAKAIEDTLEDFKTGNAAKPVFSPLLLELFQHAWLIASIDLSERNIRSGAVLVAFLSKPTFFASGRYVEVIKTISHERLLKDFWTVIKGSNERGAPEAGGGEGPGAAPGKPGGESALAKFCVDFTEKAKNGEIDPVFGRDKEIRQMIDILARRRKNNPICVGEAGVGKTAVVEGLALRIVEGDVPDLLKDTALIGLDMGALEAGAGMKGEFENRLKNVINEIKASPKPIILFIDEAHTLVGAGGSAGKGDAANLLKPALARGELRTIGATTWAEYKKYFEKDPALARRFQPVKLDEPSIETTALILRGLKEKYEQAHGVVVRDDAIVSAAEMSARYISGRQLPDKAVDLLDTAAARVKIELSSKPDQVEDKERSVQALERTKRALLRDKSNGVPIDEELLANAEKSIISFTTEAQALTVSWKKIKEASEKVVALRKELEQAEPEKAGDLQKKVGAELEAFKKMQGETQLMHIEVDPDMVAKVVSDWTGIPLGKVLHDEAKTALALQDSLGTRIKGQDHALFMISEVMKAAKSGLRDPRQPMGVFLLVGPSGVGKTESALALADLMFGGEQSTVTINMSEFQESHTVSRLIGSPPGYVGYGEGGILTEAVRQRPYTVVLLDEVEKANLQVLNLFYQVFDKGMLSDGEGREIDFRNTIMFLTSNLATDVITEMTANNQKPDMDVLVSAIRPILSEHFKPALLARMTIVPFFALDPSAMKMIVELKMKQLVKRLAENNKMKMTYSGKLVDQIAARCTEVETGARNIDHIIRGTILPQLSQEILAHMTGEGMPGKVMLDVADGGAFKIVFEG